MKKRQNLDQECDYFSAKQLGGIVKIIPRGNRLIRSTILRGKDKMLDYLDLVSKNESIKVVLIINSLETAYREEYIEFYHMVSTSKLRKDAVHRMYRAFDQLILSIVESNKFFISADSGKLYPQLFNVSLACDYRIITNNTTIQNTYLKLGLAPKGGGAYFLRKRLGHCKAFEMLLSNRNFTASEALELGIVNKVVPLEKLEEVALETAKHYTQKPAKSLTGIKRLLNYSMKDLSDYLELENQELINIIGPIPSNNRFNFGIRR